MRINGDLRIMKQRIQLGLGLLLLVVAGADAESPAGVGRQIAERGTTKGVAPCASCHGPDGGGLSGTGAPRLAGLDAGYLAKQLRDLGSGLREGAVMHAMAVLLSDAEVAAVSDYYAALPPPGVSAKPSKNASNAAVEKVRDLVEWGDWSDRRLPACARCHGPSGNGIGAYFPGLAGQQPGYLATQLQAWKRGARANDPLGLMRAVAAQLTPAEIEGLADYYAALPPGPPTPAPNAGATPSIPAPARAAPRVSADTFRPPDRDAIPAGPLGEAVRTGQAIFSETSRHPVTADYVGNRLACRDCHLDAGRLAGSAPLWAAWVAYPSARAKTRRVDSFAERLRDCFTYSLDAQDSAVAAAPPLGSEPIRALEAYSYWLATGAPTGDLSMPGRGFPPLAETDRGFDPKRGAAVYADRCALCHGEDGRGVADTGGSTLFPPLWGRGSYNWGAGMHSIDTAAAFIEANMPLGLGGSLSVQAAWDVAAFVNAHQRPQDPRFNGDLQETAERFHSSRFSLYGKVEGPDGRLLGETD